MAIHHFALQSRASTRTCGRERGIERSTGNLAFLLNICSHDHLGPRPRTATGTCCMRWERSKWQRVEDSDGALLRYGPTSLWMHKKPVPLRDQIPGGSEIMPGDWVNWSQNLPKGLDLTRELHDRALHFFDSYYGSWGLTVDMPAFMADLNVCNLVRPTRQGRSPTRTAHYSPLLHCCVMYLGSIFMRTEHPSLVGELESTFWEHASGLLLEECDQAALSSLRAYNLLAK